MRTVLFSLIVVCLTVGWGLFFYVYQNQSEIGIQKHTEQIAKTSKEINQAGDQRVSHIGDLVSQSIAIDNRTIQKMDEQIVSLNEKIEIMKTSIAQLNSDKSGLKVRLSKLHRVLSFLDADSKEEAKTKGRAEQKTSKEMVSVAAQLVDHFNRQMNEFVASLIETSSSVVISIKGETFLIIDDKPVRVSQEKSANVVPLFNKIERTYGIRQVTMRVRENADIDHIHTLSEYIKNQFGWEPKIRPVQEMKRGHSIEINIITDKDKMNAKESTQKNEKLAAYVQ